MNETLNIIGSISNAVAAIAAVIAIVVTITHYQTDKSEQKQERLAEKKGVLFKESVIDSWLKKIAEDITMINQELVQLSEDKLISNEKLKELYFRMRALSRNWLYEVEIIKVFNEKLYDNVKEEVERIVDMYSTILIVGLDQGEISKSSTDKINKRLTVIRRKIYKKYFMLE